MAETALEKSKTKLARAKELVARAREVVEETGRKSQRVLTVSVAAYGMGALEKDATAHSRQLFTIAGMNPKLLYPAAAYFIAPVVGGRVAEVLEDAALGIIAAYAYEQGLH